MPKRNNDNDTSILSSEKKKKKLSLLIPPPAGLSRPSPAAPLPPLREIIISNKNKLTVIPGHVSILDVTKPMEHAIHLTPVGWAQSKRGMSDIALERLMKSITTPAVDDDADVRVSKRPQPEDFHICGDVYLNQSLESYNDAYCFIHLKHWMIYREGGRCFPSRLGVNLNKSAYGILSDSTIIQAVDYYLAQHPHQDEATTTHAVNRQDHLQQVWLSCSYEYLTLILIAFRKQHCGACNRIPGATDHGCLAMEIITSLGFIPLLSEALQRVDEARVARRFQRRINEIDLTSPANVNVFYHRHTPKERRVQVSSGSTVTI